MFGDREVNCREVGKHGVYERHFLLQLEQPTRVEKQKLSNPRPQDSGVCLLIISFY